MKTIATFIVVALLAAGLAAQTPPPGPPSPAARVQHQISFLTTMLSLTPAQQQQATTIFTNAATQAAALHDSMHTAHQSLHDAVQSNNTGAIDQASATIGQLTTQLTSIESKAHAAFYQILSADQQAKFNALHQQHGPGHFGEHGGPPPPPHP
ncbi:MAG: Spy/CpxP family protein refolding chaperone [Terriglobales bacterium]